MIVIVVVDVDDVVFVVIVVDVYVDVSADQICGDCE